MALDQQRLGGLMLHMLERLEEIYGEERLEELELEDAVLVVTVKETDGPRGLSGLHWAYHGDTFHGQLGLLELAKIAMTRTMQDRPGGI